MLTKLMKYECKATGRAFGGLYLGLLGATLLLSFIFRFGVRSTALNETNVESLPQALTVALVVLGFVYIGLFVAIMVLSFVTVVERFRKNLLGGEGYLMHTLPVTSGQLILSKALVGTAWMIVSSGVILLSMLVIMLLVGTLDYSLVTLFVRLGQEFDVTLSAVLGALIMLVSAVLCLVLCIYAACMVGHQCKRFQMPAGVVAFFVLSGLQSWITTLLGLGGASVLRIGGGSEQLAASLAALPVSAQLWVDVAVVSVPALGFGAVYFLLTRWLMNNRLNLE